MLSSCCSWFCLDSATVDEREANSAGAPQPPQQGAYVNSGYSPSPPQPEHSCKACGGRFDTPARKHVCVDCKKNYCGHCSAQLEPRPRLCHTCQRFYGNLIERAELMKLKVKDLRDYLHLHEVPTQMCREKEELVDLVLGQQTPSSDGYEPPSSDPPSSQDLPDDAPAPTATHRSTDTTITIDITSISPNVGVDPPDATTTTASSTPPSTSTSTESVPPPNTQDDNQVSDPEELVVTGRRASMSDISCLEDIESLSVRQLKEILARNFVDYKGCCEKWELMERVTRLYHDNKDRQNIANSTADDTDPSGTVGGLQEDSLCRICMDSPIDCVLLECGHMVTCSRCGKRMNECPICRQYVVRAVHVFRS